MPEGSQIIELEEQIKKYLCGRFEDERITQVKKTCNWNIMISDKMKKVFQADDKFVDQYEGVIREELAPGDLGKGGDYDPNRAAYKKYFVDRKMGGLLIDFEEYMLQARQGATESRMRDLKDKKDVDEDIRAGIVQEVSQPISS